ELRLAQPVGPQQLTQYIRLGSIGNWVVFVLIAFDEVRQDVEILLRPFVQVFGQQSVADFLSCFQVRIIPDVGERKAPDQGEVGVRQFSVGGLIGHCLPLLSPPAEGGVTRWWHPLGRGRSSRRGLMTSAVFGPAVLV